jgi:Predicted metal-dependent membrane protease
MKFLERALDNQNQIWKYIVMALAVWIGAQIIGGIPLFIVIIINLATNGAGAISPQNMMDFSVLGISQNVGLLLMLIPFIVGILVMIPLLRGLHKRTLSETINGRKKIRWNRFLMGAFVWTVLMGIYFVVSYFISPDNFVLQFEIGKFIPLLLISLLLIPWQASLEEIFFRGYLAQGIAAWTKSRWLAIIIPGVIFGLMHFRNPEVNEFGFWATMPQYIGFGLFFGLISILDDGIELAMGAHVANNIFSSVFITHKASALQTPAVFEQLTIDIHHESLTLFISCILAILIFSRKYKWNFSILNKKITNNSENIS